MKQIGEDGAKIVNLKIESVGIDWRSEDRHCSDRRSSHHWRLKKLEPKQEKQKTKFLVEIVNEDESLCRFLEYGGVTEKETNDAFTDKARASMSFSWVVAPPQFADRKSLASLRLNCWDQFHGGIAARELHGVHNLSSGSYLHLPISRLLSSKVPLFFLDLQNAMEQPTKKTTWRVM